MAIRGRVVSRQRVCKYCGDLHEVGNWPHNCREPEPARSDFPSPAVISDALPGGINGLYHHAAERTYDSKHAYREATRRWGCEELGNEFDAHMKEREYRAPEQNSIESSVNDALHQHGISSESDMGKIQHAPD